MNRFSALALLLLAGLALPGATPARAAEPDLVLTIKDHKFEPARAEVPANKALVILVKNLDATPEEFESDDLRIEKIIPGGSEGVFRIKPLKPGEYKFIGEFNEATAKGVLVAK